MRLRNKYNVCCVRCGLRTVMLGIMMMVSIVGMSAVLEGSATPNRVGVGDQFRLSYTIATHSVSDISLGNLPESFDVLVGPSISNYSLNINGRKTESLTFTYVLMANKAGTFTIPPAKAKSGGKVVTSNAVTVTVSGQRSSSGSQQSGNGQRPSASGIRPTGSKITGNDLFITVSASRNRVCEQEPVMLTYKLYTLVELSSLDGKMPDLNGFHTQELSLPQQKQYKVETYNGRQYNTVVCRQYMMYPQVTGNLTIPSITFHGSVITRDSYIDPFEAMFNGGGISEVAKEIVAPAVKIQVDSLPARPAGFSGGVGHFSISATLEPNTIKTGEPMKVRVTVSGNGNLKLIKQPELKLPKDFDVYDPKVEDETQLTDNGLGGSMVYEYLCVPRKKGKYTINPIEFVYFDTTTRRYETAKTQSFSVDVQQGEENGEYSEREALRLLNSDIRYIKTGDVEMRRSGDHFFLGAAFWLILSLALICFIVLLVVFRQRAIDNANVAKMRGKRANKVATKRLKTAGKLLQMGKNNEFYDEVLKALWGYVGDKLNMPVEDLSKDNISEKFIAANVGEELVGQFTGVLDECEFARFAPGDKVGNMEKVYESAASVIEKIEETMKQNKKSGHGHTLPIVLAFVFALMATMSANATTKADADSAYVGENYEQAIRLYNELLKQGESADVYFNLGNAYYRDKNYTHAIINYERALLLDPGDGDIRFNLDMARTKTIDKIVPKGEMFFVTWYRTVVNVFSVDAWATLAVISFILMLALFMLYLLNSKINIRKIGFYSAVFMLFVFCISMIAAFQQKHQIEVRDTAIVTSSAVNVKSTPAENGTDLFVIHEGTKANIIDDTMKEWKEVVLDDGKRGWIMTSDMERI